MRQWIDTAIYLAYFVRHLTPVMWRYTNGGFFCWRDAPLWIVRDVAASEGPDTAPELRDLYAQAADELKLRDARKDCEPCQPNQPRPAASATATPRR